MPRAVVDAAAGARQNQIPSRPPHNRTAACINDDTRVIAGHGPVATKRELRAYRDMIQTVRDRVKASLAKGESLHEILASKPTREFDAQNATDRVDGDAFTTMVYESLTGARVDWKHGQK